MSGFCFSESSPNSVLDKLIATIVIPAEAGIHSGKSMDSHLRENDM